MNWKEKEKLNPIEKDAITEGQLQKYAEASGDFNPIHLKPEFAKEAGYPNVIAHGMLSMAFIADGLVFNFPENQYRVEELSSRFKKVTLPGDKLTVKGEIKKVDLQKGSLLVSLWTENQRGEITTQAEATLVKRS